MGFSLAVGGIELRFLYVRHRGSWFEYDEQDDCFISRTEVHYVDRTSWSIFSVDAAAAKAQTKILGKRNRSANLNWRVHDTHTRMQINNKS